MRNRLSKSREPITVRDVANALDLSPSTVSRALNNKGRVSEKTRKKILKVVEEVGYRPSRAALSLVTKRATNIGFLVSRRQIQATRSFYGEVLAGTESAARALDYRLIFSTNAMEDAPLLIAEGRVDGIILAGCNPSFR